LKPYIHPGCRAVLASASTVDVSWWCDAPKLQYTIPFTAVLSCQEKHTSYIG